MNATDSSNQPASANNVENKTRAGQPRLMMCPPDFYGIHYEINPWMDRRQNADLPIAQKQWKSLVKLYEDKGAAIELVNPVQGLPDMVFTANAAVVYGKRAVLAQFRHEQRQPESSHFARWFYDHDFEVMNLPVNLPFEGAGDALFCGDTLFTGYIHRSDMRAMQALGSLLDCQVLCLELVDPYFYHLDTCFCPLSPGMALYYPPAFDEYAQKVLAEHIPNLIEVNEDDARRFACNAVVLGEDVIMNDGVGQVAEQLYEVGFSVHTTCLDEFLKAGGAAKCLTLRLDGEEAAGWRGK